MEDMEKLLENMTKMKDGMEAMQQELASYVEHYSENGVTLDVHGDGVITGLTFADGTSANTIQTAINNANAKIKDYITKKMNDITPAELREQK